MKDNERLTQVVDLLISDYKARTKTEIAEKVGYDRSHFSNIMSGRPNNNITPKLLSRFKEHYNVNPDYILKGAEPMFLGVKIEKPEDTIDVNEYIRRGLKYNDQLINEPKYRQYILLLASEIEVLIQKEEFNRDLGIK